MSILEIELTPELEQRLRDKALRHGLSTRDYARSLVLEDLAQETPAQTKHSIMELHGIGRGAWAGVDVQEYINAMRDEWDQPE